MKKLKKLNRRQKQILMSNGFEYINFLVEIEGDRNHTFTFVHRETKEKLELRYK